MCTLNHSINVTLNYHIPNLFPGTNSTDLRLSAAPAVVTYIQYNLAYMLLAQSHSLMLSVLWRPESSSRFD